MWDEKTIAFTILSLDEAGHIFVTKRWELQEVIGMNELKGLYFQALWTFFPTRISPSFKTGIIRLEAGAFKFSNFYAIGFLWRRCNFRENNMRYSAK